MNSTEVREVVADWLTAHCGCDLVLELWIYGSYLQAPSTASDVDVLIKYRKGRSRGAANLRRRIERMFRAEFVSPLHAIFLSETEWCEEAAFVTALLKSSRRLV